MEKKYCANCSATFRTNEVQCPFCGNSLLEWYQFHSNKYHAEISEWKWDLIVSGLKALFNKPECVASDFDDCEYVELCIGTVFDIMPSKKYYTAWACSNVTDEEIELDMVFLEALNDIAANYGLSVGNSEADPTDIVVIMSREKSEV